MVHRKVLALSLLALPIGAQSPLFGSRTRDVFSDPQPLSALLPIDGDGDGRTDLLGVGGSLVFHRQAGPMRFVGTAMAVVGLGNIPAVGDIDGDGDLDVCTGQLAMRNDGAGGFSPVVGAVPPFGASPLLMVPRAGLGDLDGDGDLDLVAASNSLFVARNDGTGTFTDATAATLQTAGAGFSHFALLDADGDGDLDIAAILGNVDQPWLFVNDGQAIFTPQRITAGGLVFGIFGNLRAVDLDGDSDQDLVVGSAGLPLQLLRNDGGGVFVQIAHAGLPGLSHHYPWGDLNGDGRAELVTTTGVWSPSPTWQFSRLELPPVPSAATPVLGDFDGDLDLDIAFPGEEVAVVANTHLGFVLVTSHGLGSDIGLLPFGGVRGSGGFWPSTTILGTRGIATDSVIGSFPVSDRGFVHWRLSSSQPIRSNTLFADPQTGLGAVTCEGGAAVGWMVDNGQLVPRVPALPAIAATHVAAGDLDGSFAEELVFGDAATDGPRILTFGTLGTWTQAVPNLPSAAPHPAAAREVVRLGDLDADGDLDVVHEFRVLWNGGVAGWLVGPSFGGFVDGQAQDLQLVDYDGDGDQDVIVCRGGPLTLLRNDRTAFVDVTLGTIPIAALFGVELVTAGDVDADGDLDLLLASFPQSNLLRNDGGVFALIQAVGPFGVLADGDHDGRPDLFDGRTFHWNLFAHLFATRRATSGGDWLLEVRTWRHGPPASFAFLAVGTGSSFAELPGLGIVRVDPNRAAVVPLPLVQGAGSHLVSIPRTPGMLGVQLAAQALVLDPQRVALTGAVIDIVR